MKLEKEQLLKLYTNLVRVRKADELLVKSLLDGKIVSFFHSQQGQEAVAVGACTFLRKDDYLYFPHRGHGVAQVIAKGGSLKAYFAEHYGKATGACLGMSGWHFVAPELGILGISGILGTSFVVSAGWGLAAKKRGKQQVVVTFFGDGESNRGTLHEALNLSSLLKLPIIWLCQNNLYAQFMPIKDAYPRADIADLAAGYNIPGLVVDGQDVMAVYEAVQMAVDKARAGNGPTFIEAKTYRYYSHIIGRADIIHHSLRSKEEVEQWKKRDPVKLFQDKLLEQDVITQADIKRIDAEAAAEAEQADRFALESPIATPEVLLANVFTD